MEPMLLSMAIIRLLSSIMEFTAAMFFLKSKSIEKALRINAFLGLLGPLVFVTVSSLGIISIADKIPVKRLVIVILGVMLIIIGTASSN